jgi:hypothetical protein
MAHYVFFIIGTACVLGVRHNALPTMLLGAFMKNAMLFTASGTLIKKENKIFLKYKEIQMGAVAKPYMRNGFLILYIRKCIFNHI